MTDKTWSSGTVIDSPWLQDVNNATYRAASGNPSTTLRTALSKFSDTVSLLDFEGANRAGAGDNALAMQVAISCVVAIGTYGTVYVPAGRYRFNSSITIPKGISIRGDGGLATVLEFYDCDGLTITPSTWDQNMAFYRDIGIKAMSGTNRTGFRCATAPYLGEQDGFYISNCQFFGWDTSIYFGSCWQSVVRECYIENTNTAVRLDGHAVLNIIENNQIIRGTGGLGAAANLGVQFGFTDIEANILENNFIFGFQRCVQLDEPWFCQIKGNTMLATALAGAAIECIVFSTVKEKLIIENNILEGAPQAGSAFIAVYGRPLNSSSGASTTIAKNRFFDDTSAGSGSIGLKINDTALTNQHNIHAYDNNFVGFTTNDIRVDNASNVHLRDNDCLSTAPVNSIVVQGSVTAPVVVAFNKCAKAVSLDATALANGSIYDYGNTKSGTYTPPDLTNQTWVPTDASGAGLVFTGVTARYSKVGYKQYIASVDLTYPVTASGANASIGGLPAAPAAPGSGGVGYSTVGSYVGWQHNTTAQLALFDATGALKTNAQMSGKRIILTIPFFTT